MRVKPFFEAVREYQQEQTLRMFRAGVPTSPVDPSSPPTGAWFRDIGDTVEIGTTTRCAEGWVLAVLLLAFAMGLGFLSVWMIVALVDDLRLGIYERRDSTAGMMFILSGLCGLSAMCLGGAVVYLLLGQVRVRVTSDAIEVFEGVPMIGVVRTVPIKSVTSVHELLVYRRRQSRWYIEPRIGMHHSDGKQLSFGGRWAIRRWWYLLGSLCAVIAARNDGRTAAHVGQN